MRSIVNAYSHLETADRCCASRKSSDSATAAGRIEARCGRVDARGSRSPADDSRRRIAASLRRRHSPKISRSEISTIEKNCGGGQWVVEAISMIIKKSLNSKTKIIERSPSHSTRKLIISIERSRCLRPRISRKATFHICDVARSYAKLATITFQVKRRKTAFLAKILLLSVVIARPGADNFY